MWQIKGVKLHSFFIESFILNFFLNLFYFYLNQVYDENWENKIRFYFWMVSNFNDYGKKKT